MTAVATTTAVAPTSISNANTLNHKEAAAGSAEASKKYYMSIGKAADAAEVAKLVTDAFRKAYPFRPDNADRVTVSEYLEQINKGTWYLLRESNSTTNATVKTDKIVAALLYEVIAQDRGSIEIVARHVDYKKMKVGADLIDRVENTVNAKSIAVWCVVNSQGTETEEPKLPKYYESLGYMRTSKVGKFDNAYLKPAYHDKIKICQLVKIFEK